jgi:hypothetical protein
MLLQLIKTTAPAADILTEDRIKALAGLGAAIITIVVAIIVEEKLYQPWYKSLSKEKKIPKAMNHEMEYAEYLKWAAENGHAPHFNK